jgi:hypothetical protein
LAGSSEHGYWIAVGDALVARRIAKTQTWCRLAGVMDFRENSLSKRDEASSPSRENRASLAVIWFTMRHGTHEWVPFF